MPDVGKLARMCGNMTSHALVGVYIGTTTLKNCWAGPSKVRHTHTLWPSGSTLRKWKRVSTKRLVQSVHTTLFRVAPSWKTHLCLPINSWTDVYTVDAHTVKYCRAMRMNDLLLHTKIHMHLTTQLREWRQLRKSTYCAIQFIATPIQAKLICFQKWFSGYPRCLQLG